MIQILKMNVVPGPRGHGHALLLGRLPDSRIQYAMPVGALRAELWAESSTRVRMYDV